MSSFKLPALTGANLKHTKAYNLRIVLETIRTCSPISRANIARRTSLTPQTVSNIVGELVDGQIVLETSQRREGRGAPSTMLKVNAEIAFSVGLDLDRDHLTGIIVDLDGTVRARSHEELNFPSPEAAVDLMEAMAQDLIAEAGVDTSLVSGIGVGIPGPLHITDESLVSNAVSPDNFPGWQNVPVVTLLRNRLDLPVHLENNASAAAVGELWYGAGKSISSFFYLYFGAGLGGGLVVNGRPYSGHTGNAGDIGYLPASFFQRALQSIPSHDKPSIIGEPFHLPHLYARLNERGIDASLPSDLETLFLEGNEIVHEWTERAATILAPMLMMVEYTLDPAAVFFGGRLPSPLLSAIIDGLNEALPQYRHNGKAASPSLLKATAGLDAAALGVATLPIYELFAPSSVPHPRPSILYDGNSIDGEEGS